MEKSLARLSRKSCHHQEINHHQAIKPMKKLSASLTSLITTTLNGVMCWGINQLPGKSELPIAQELFFGITVFCMVGLGFCSTQSGSSQTTSETTNRAWFIGLPPVIGSIVLFLLLKGDHLPSNLVQYAGYASLFLFVMGTLLPTLNAFVQIRQNPRVTPSSSSNLARQDYRNRQALLNRVKYHWIKGFLEGSLSNRSPIELGLEERFDAVQLDWQTPEQPRRSLPKGTKAINQFDKMGEGCTMLILGDPGSGKTTTLLQMAQELIERAEQNTELPIPVVFNLSSWAAITKQSLAEWLVEELKTQFKIPQKIATNWVESEDLLLLLDGLDEVAEERREDCVLAINGFKNSYGTTEMVVCSRIKDYESLSSRLEFQGAIFIEDLTLEQISNYFEQVGDRLKGVKEVWVKDKVLQELTKTPLMLSIIAITYENISATELPQMPLEKRREHLFSQYIQKMLNRRQQNQQYSAQKTLHWLTWLSKNMSSKSQTVFFIERMQPSWLSKEERFWYGTTFFTVPILLGGSLVYFWNIPIFFKVLAFLCLFIYAFTVVSVSTQKINPMQSLKISTLLGAIAFSALIIGAAASILIVIVTIAQYIFSTNYITLSSSLIAEVLWKWSFFFWILVLVIWLIGIASSEENVVELTIKPNHGIYTSLKNGFTILFILITGFSILTILTNFEVVWSTLIVVFMWIFCPPMFACIQHFALRVTLTLSGKTPWNYAKFLDYATERIFLQKIGGGYIFIHRMLLEHLASGRADNP
ncbi:NACHT domain-containing protein [Limnospira fusiformis]|uniref:NACHT domain-containing protein n=1 Tax=Limnospira fusiformis TaxID=54297 RepID=UPI0034E08578